MMKKFRYLALFLIICLMCQLSSVAFAMSDDANEVKVPVNSDEFLMFKSFGMTNSEMEQISGEDTVTRAQFSYILANIMGYSGNEHDVEYTFIDVKSDNPYSGAIYYLKNLGIVNGVNSYQFKPEDSITYDMASKMAVNALGYTELAKAKYGEYPYGTRNMAFWLKLDEGISYIPDAKMTVNDAFVFLKNTAFAPALNADKYINGAVAYESGDDTLMSIYRDIEFGKGIMTDNGITALSGGSTLGTGRVIIDGKKLHCDYKNSEYKLIGKYVDYYYNSQTDTLLYASVYDKMNKILEINANDLAIGNSGYSINNVVYYYNDTQKNAKISVNADLIYNGSSYPVYNINDLKPQSGKLTLIDNNSDKVYDVIVVEEYEDYIGVFADEEVINYKNGTIYTDKCELLKIYKDGTQTDINAIVKDCVISVLRSHDDKFVEIYVSNAKINGTVTKVGENTDGKTEYTVNGETYIASKALKGTTIDLGRDYTLYLSVNNQIVSVEESYGSDWEIAYYVGVKNQGSSLSNRIVMRVVLTDGKYYDLDVSEKVMLNGSVVKNDALLTNSDLVHLASGDFIRQPVKINISQKGEVIGVETVSTDATPYGYNPDKFSFDGYVAAGTYKGNNARSIAKYTVKPDAIVFKDPHLRAGSSIWDKSNANKGFGEVGEVDKVRVQVGNGIGDGATISDVYFYDVDETLTANIVVYRDTTSGGGYEVRLLTVDEVVTRLDDNGETTKVVYGVSQNNTVEYKEKYKGVIPSGLKKGDVCRFKHDGGMLEEVDVLASLADNPQPFISGSIVNNEWSNTYGYLYAKSDNAFSVVTPEGHVQGPLVSFSLNGTACSITVYDMNKGEVYPGTTKDIYVNTPVDGSGNEEFDEHSTTIFVLRRYDVAREVVVVHK